MSRQFRLDRIWLTVSDPADLMGDIGNEVYRYIGPTEETRHTADLDPKCWSKDGVMFRDYWRFFCDRRQSNGVYFTNVLELEGKELKFSNSVKPTKVRAPHA